MIDYNIENYFELIDIIDIEDTDIYENMVDISIDNDESFSLSNGIVSHNSASSMVLSGIEKKDKNYYGIFPLRGKPLNVRDATMKKITENEEIKNIINILGLEYGKKYTDTNDLRYGKIVLLSDADCVHCDTKIRTKKGDKKIKDLSYDDEVLTSSGLYRKILNIIETKKEKYVEITIRNEKIKFGEYHKIHVNRDGDIQEIYAKDIIPTDLLLYKK